MYSKKVGFTKFLTKSSDTIIFKLCLMWNLFKSFVKMNATAFQENNIM